MKQIFLILFLFGCLNAHTQGFLEERENFSEYLYQFVSIPFPSELHNENRILKSSGNRLNNDFYYWLDYFQEQVIDTMFNPEWGYVDFNYQIEIDKKGKVVSVKILNPSIHEEINKEAYRILNTIKTLDLFPALKKPFLVEDNESSDFTLDSYLLFDMCNCAYDYYEKEYGITKKPWHESEEEIEEQEIPKNLVVYSENAEEEYEIVVPEITGEEFAPEAEVFTVVEDMPIFGKCDQSTGDNAYDCSHENVKSFIEEEVAKVSYAEGGKIYVRFVIDENGNLMDPEVVKSAGENLDKLALEIVNKMQDWEPGKQRGKPVKVQYVVPVNFK